MSQSTAGGVATYVSYAVGMGTVILALSVTAALARSGVTSRLRLISRHAGGLSGALMLAGGAYAVWYGRWELAVYRGDLTTDPLVEGVEVVRRGKVRRAKLYYLRERRGKSARIVENSGTRAKRLNDEVRQKASEEKSRVEAEKIASAEALAKKKAEEEAATKAAEEAATKAAEAEAANNAE